ncbi:hypothetical protein BpHYR1_020448, partial [Brachionus plicatilis]
HKKATQNKNKINLCKTVFKALIRPHLDYLFIALSTSTQRVLKDLQKIQNKIFKTIKYFPLRTRISTIHQKLSLQTISVRTDLLFEKFVANRQNHTQINDDLRDSQNTTSPSHKYWTYFDKFRHVTWNLDRQNNIELNP